MTIEIEAGASCNYFSTECDGVLAVQAPELFELEFLVEVEAIAVPPKK